MSRIYLIMVWYHYHICDNSIYRQLSSSKISSLPPVFHVQFSQPHIKVGLASGRDTLATPNVSTINFTYVFSCLDTYAGVTDCARISYCSLFLSGTITKNYTSCKKGTRHILRFLFIRRLATILLVGGLGVEDRMTSANPQSCSIRFTLVGLGQIGSLPVQTKSVWQNWI